MKYKIMLVIGIVSLASPSLLFSSGLTETVASAIEKTVTDINTSLKNLTETQLQEPKFIIKTDLKNYDLSTVCTLLALQIIEQAGKPYLPKTKYTVQDPVEAAQLLINEIKNNRKQAIDIELEKMHQKVLGRKISKNLQKIYSEFEYIHIPQSVYYDLCDIAEGKRMIIHDLPTIADRSPKK